MNEASDKTISGVKIKTAKNKLNVLYFRWLFIVLIIVEFCLASKDSCTLSIFLETLALAITYNVLATLYFLKSSDRRNSIFSLAVYSDIIFVTVFSYQSGGINSDMYIVFIFIIGYFGINNNFTKTISVSIFSIIIYSISCFFFAHRNLEDFNFIRLIIRDIFIVLIAYGIAIILGEVKKFDEMHKREFKLARTDKLTGLANRHYFDQKLNEEAEYALRSGNPLNILLFDLDNFKKFNDSYGHVWGDKLLALFSDIIKQNIRKSDIPVRYGGEEFLILVRDLDEHAAMGVGDRIRRQLEKQKIYVGNDDERKRVTVSCGVAQYPKHSPNIKEVVDLADKALYNAKENGKNVVISYNDMI